MGIGNANYVYWSTGPTAAGAAATAFIARVTADGGTVESRACLLGSLNYLIKNP